MLCVCVALSTVAVTHAQTVTQPADPAPSAPSPPDTAAKADNLDKLLDIADKDVSQLSQVKVAGTGSPALDTPVSTVSRQESTVGHSPAAVFVITNEMIRRSGAKEVPELLRMVPGLEVAKIDSNKWAISARGFNGRFANSLLVQIDGRTVYTPLFAGVFWDVQDLLLEDVERIEVIRGPGGTLWGANAVNGIINILTKNAKDTQGAYVESGAGSYERGYTSVRYGGRIGEDLFYRFYGKWFERGTGSSPDMPEDDSWRQGRGGFRADWNASPDDKVTLQGDYYNGYSGDRSVFPLRQGADVLALPPYNAIIQGKTYVTGENVNLQWKRDLAEGSDWTARLYYDRTNRVWETYGFADDCAILDFDFQHRFPVGSNHELIWGFGYRNTKDMVQSSTPAISLDPASRSDNVFSCFAQDQITLAEDLWYLTLGSKLEHNDYTGIEIQPSIRLLWTPDKQRSIWGAISRAVRTPSHGETAAMDTLAAQAVPPDVPLPIYPAVVGNPHLKSEELIAYELGYREQMTERFSWDLALFINSYQRICSAVAGTLEPVYLPYPYLVLPMTISNDRRGCVYGAELAATYAISPTWRLQGAYTYLLMDIRPLDGETQVALNGQSPSSQVYLQSGWDLGGRWELDLIGRYVDALPDFGVPSYIVGDARLAWHWSKNLEFSVVGRNLLHGAHAEFSNDYQMGALRTLVRPEVYGQLVWRY